MLVLTRKRSEMIRIGDQIEVVVIHSGKGGVKIGIQAPPSVRVMRGELAPEKAPAPLASMLKRTQKESAKSALVEVSPV